LQALKTIHSEIKLTTRFKADGFKLYEIVRICAKNRKYCIIADRVRIKGMEIALSRDRKLIFSVLLL